MLLNFGSFVAEQFDTTGTVSQPRYYRRRSTFKISLYTGGTALVQYAGLTLLLRRGDMLFTNPLVPYSCEMHTDLQGYYCEFTDDFLLGADRTASMQESPLFRLGSNPLVQLDEPQLQFLSTIFAQLTQSGSVAYRHRTELLRTYVQVLVHTALLHQPTQPPPPQAPTAWLASRFLELLERQFPVASPAQPVRLRTPAAFAGQLGVHVNYLNRAVRTTTGRPTSAHLAERFVREAQGLLRHTAWSVADIAHGLGFGEATYFNQFFHKHVGCSPTAYRQQPAS